MSVFCARLVALASALGAAIALQGAAIAQDIGGQRWSIAIHGGAGTMDPDKMTAEQQADYKVALQAAMDAGAAILAEGGTALDAVEITIKMLEDDPRFNAGRGAVFTWDGTNELDASIMDGRNRSAGAATGLTRTRHPISLARQVMEDSPHVFLSGAGAEEFARERGLEEVDPEFFATEPRREALERMKSQQTSWFDIDLKYGTVGAVALDQQGDLAAGTSTGGLTGKRWGRIGDAPVIGAGTYADNRACAVSATGAGEYFIRVGVAHEICTRMRMQRKALPQQLRVGDPHGAATSISQYFQMLTVTDQIMADNVMAEVKELGGDGGVIVATPEGHTFFSFNTPGMYRGRKDSTGLNEVAIFKDAE